MDADAHDSARLDPDSPKGCPRPMREIRRCVEAETGRVGHDFCFGRTAVIDGVRFWIWGIIDEGETLYVDVSERAGSTLVSMASGEGRSVEDYVRAQYGLPENVGPGPHVAEVEPSIRERGPDRVDALAARGCAGVRGRMERVRPAESVAEVLTDDQKRIMRRVLDQEEARREHVVVYLSGAHAYGFPSPDSDLDFKAIHVARTEDLLGFEVPSPTVDRAEVLDGVEIDYTSNELAHALSGILAGNGNFIERVLGRMVPHGSALLAELRPIVRRSLSRRVHRHYRGFAQNQLRFLEREPTAKKLLYVLRTTLTGIHLLKTGELEADVTRIMDRYGFANAAALVERKRAGERVALDPAQLEAWRPRVESLFAALDAARDASVLPEEPANEEEVRAWLMTVRRARFSA